VGADSMMLCGHAAGEAGAEIRIVGVGVGMNGAFPFATVGVVGMW